jgi:hypothetical protein
MRVADLLAESTAEDLERLAHEHAKTEEQMARPQLLVTIEGVLRSYRFLQEFLINRQPPTFAIMVLLLDAPDFALPTSSLRELVLIETARICDALDARLLLERDDQLRVYRRVLYQARSNDKQIDSSEAAILGVLRQELDIAQVEHCLIEHHADLREFWRQDGAFVREIHELRSAGLVFAKNELTLLPEDLAPVVRQVLGIDMARGAARRLFSRLSGQELHGALQAIRAPVSGSKEDRIERLVAHMTQPRAVLRETGLDSLRTICRDIGAAVAGTKEELVDRIVGHVAAGRDMAGEPAPPPAPPPIEPRRLSETRFALLFEQLRGHQLAGILAEFDLRRRWGTKGLQVRTLWDAHRSESTLLACLSNQELDTVLRRLDLKTGGSKADRTDRLIEHFALVDEIAFRAAQAPANDSDSASETA